MPGWAICCFCKICTQSFDFEIIFLNIRVLNLSFDCYNNSFAKYHNRLFIIRYYTTLNHSDFSIHEKQAFDLKNGIAEDKIL